MKSVIVSMLVLSLTMLGCGGNGDDGKDKGDGGGDANQPKTVEQVREEAKTMDLAQLEKAFEEADKVEDAKQEEVKALEEKINALTGKPESAAELSALQGQFAKALSELQDLVAIENVYRQAIQRKKAAAGNE